MISKIASNINFQGRVTLGKNPKHANRIIEDIGQIPDKNAGAIIKHRIEILRKQLAKETADDVNLYIDFEYNKRCPKSNSHGDTVFIMVKNTDKSDKARPICASPGTFFFTKDEGSKDRMKTIDRIFDFAKETTLWHLENNKQT